MPTFSARDAWPEYEKSLRELHGMGLEMNHFAKAVDNLDAAVFSGDGLINAENRDLFRQSMERWQRKLIEWEEIAAQVAANDTP